MKEQSDIAIITLSYEKALSVREYWRIFIFVSFLNPAIKNGDFASTLHHRYQASKKNLTIKDKNLATRIEQAVKEFSAVEILPNFQTLKNNI